MSIKLNLKGFDDLIKDIEKAGGSANRACESAVRASAQIMQTELKNAMSAAGVDSGLVGRMPQFEIENEKTRVTARVGYRKGSYNPDDPSDGFKVVFLNYGTPHRSKHGKVVAKGFIAKAKSKAKPKIKKQQKAALEKILGRLGK